MRSNIELIIVLCKLSAYMYGAILRNAAMRNLQATTYARPLTPCNLGSFPGPLLI